jgi:hypothetical protein
LYVSVCRRERGRQSVCLKKERRDVNRHFHVVVTTKRVKKHVMS